MGSLNNLISKKKDKIYNNFGKKLKLLIDMVL